ncbi:hypothetical protein SAMN02799630_05836 [Paenibacillus sp. UNCCL117]|uniref:hypothetical protein n=1 Tax=unclassified Paenibacillus TaxID=185978 RepID=UPI00088A07AE|nr:MULTISPECIES: hypothetical protein [unclassified Paenibacillus]SDB98742.1 hypothetical protein SAMN04488602_10113 [Paenibacillus sp. cl123]SFW69000.1 hypothetical protein SAMN02799630_05836 [Paenibacillus sp. UNCCL117]
MNFSTVNNRASRPFVLVFAVILLFSFLAPVIEVSVATRTAGVTAGKGFSQVLSSGDPQPVRTGSRSALAFAYMQLLLSRIRIRLPGLVMSSTVPTRLRISLLRPLKFTSHYVVWNLQLFR